LIVEDDGSIRSALGVALRGEGYNVRSEANGCTIREVADAFRPDLAILDVRLPVGPDGYELARRLRERGDVPLIFLTSADSIGDRLAGFDAGGDDYIVKPFSTAELLARVQALLRRSGRLTSPTWEFGDIFVDDGARTVTRGGAAVELTKTEYDLLAVLIRHANQVVSKTQLLTQVWGFDAYDTNLVEVHLSAMRRKLEANGPRVVHTVHGVGYMLKS